MPKKTKKKLPGNRKSVGRRKPSCRPDFSALPEIKIGGAVSDDDLTRLLSSLIYIADDYTPEIPLPYELQDSAYIGVHQVEKEVMMFFPGARTKQEFPIVKTESFNSKHYLFAAFPDSRSPIAEVGLLYVCREVPAKPTVGDIFQFHLDSVDGTWIVRG